jgi:threonine synthase
MKFVSTRDPGHTVTLSDAIAKGIAPDGGLYIPDEFPMLTPADFEGVTALDAIATRLIAPFARDDRLAEHLTNICREALNFPAPLKRLRKAPSPLSVLELFHGPTSAFKDFGARFLAASLERIRRGAKRKLTILVATSGDTGGAVAAAFHKRPRVEVVVLYPEGLVSPRQAQQLACWGDNVRTFAVAGNFDDCQRLVKEAFADESLTRTHHLSSANSINVGRLLPQMVYYARSSLEIWRTQGRKPNYVIPTGNLGNALACVWARRAGLPIGAIVLATNANLAVTQFLTSGNWKPRQSVATLASAMDVGNPSNMERLRSMYSELEQLRAQVTAHSVSDEEIRARIRTDLKELGEVWCPHTATAAEVYRRVVVSKPSDEWIVVATAHPAKFNEIVEPLIGREVEVPEPLAKLLSLPRQESKLEPSLPQLRAQLQGGA